MFSTVESASSVGNVPMTVYKEDCPLIMLLPYALIYSPIKGEGHPPYVSQDRYAHLHYGVKTGPSYARCIPIST
jgi:hypothetical protein